MSVRLWSPSIERIKRSNLAGFATRIASEFDFDWQGDYQRLHRWSVDQSESFWSSVWDYCGIRGEMGTEAKRGTAMLDTRWFPQARLNFAENLLMGNRHIEFEGDTEPIAIIECDELGRSRRWTRSQLLQGSLAFATYLRGRGVDAGDRVAAVLPNGAAAVVTMLGTAAIGAIWTSCSPDFGDDAIVDRFSQVEPKVIVTQSYCQYHGKLIEPLAKVQRLLARLPSVHTLVAAQPIDASSDSEAPASPKEAPALPKWEFDASPKSMAGPSNCESRWLVEVLRQTVVDDTFRSFPFDHPLYIVYSSGTTGAPKCIVHGAGGSLLQHAKELQLHSDLQFGDRLFYYTTTGWMMWNWLVSGLQTGATIVLYDGSPLHPEPDSLFRLAAEQRITHFGASAKYYTALEKADCHPKQSHDLRSLRVVLSTGSPLLPESFDYIYREIHSDVQLASISGGTDILSCFVLGNPTGSVYRGEIQCAGLGMDVQVFDDQGNNLQCQPGELVCASAFPSMPISFWNDPDQAKYRSSYFERFENIWCHGDWAESTSNGGFIIYGRSDATLNPGGVRIGTAEIYRQVETFECVAESLATAYRTSGDEQIVLFVRMKSGRELDESLEQAIRSRLRQNGSPRHVPKWILAVPDLPRTISGKLSELAVRNAIHGLPIKNEAALANPECLNFFRALEGTFHDGP